MAKGKNQHVLPRNGEWTVKGAGNARVTAVVGTQREAIQIAREIASNQKSEMLIHGRNGQIRAKDSYGKDDCPPKG